jgi:regulator of replication initiation timing
MMPDGAGPCIGYEQAYAAISALEKERDEAISQRNDWKRDFDYVYDERKSLRAEVERLREALDGLVKAAGPQDLKRPPFSLVDALNIARAALKGKP